eukprot:6602427-Pyramimonas_sp.AAC.1
MRRGAIAPSRKMNKKKKRPNEGKLVVRAPKPMHIAAAPEAAPGKAAVACAPSKAVVANAPGQAVEAGEIAPIMTEG